MEATDGKETRKALRCAACGGRLELAYG